MGVTVTVKDVVAVVEPDVPVTVMVAVPVAVELAATVIVLPLTLAVTPELELEAVRATVPVKPPTSVTVILSGALEPCDTDSDVGDAASEKPVPGTTMVMGADSVIVPLVPTILTG